jgi:hypothetical protein
VTRPCRIDNCTRTARTGRTLCDRHRKRIALHHDPHFNTWTVADANEVELLVRDPRPVHGLTRLERRLIALGLTERDMPADEIARILDVTPRTVYRWRATA